MILLLHSALAWQSTCYTGLPDIYYPWHPGVCEDGYESARGRLVWDEGFYTQVRRPEHVDIWDHAVDRSGLPRPLMEDFELETYVRPDHLVDDLTSIRARRVLVAEKHVRTLRPAEMTQLPDMSFTLWDWAMGNETCPVDSAIDPQACHEFTRHLGGMNSSHFPPQTQSFYQWYHELALDRAEQCRAADYALSELYEARPQLEEYVLACEKSAITLEAVGQHYLHDSWSSGHMWERWGSPEFDDWLAISNDDPAQALGRAMVVGAFSGSWHGVKAVLDDPSSLFYTGLIPGVEDPWVAFDDPMCAPAPLGLQVRYGRSEAPGMHHAVGDIFFEEALLDGRYADQLQAMTSCGVLGMREVYGATGQVHGGMGALSGSIDPSFDPAQGDACFSQRASNEALNLGAAIHVGEHPYQVMAPVGLRFAIWGLASVNYSGDADVDLEGLKEGFRADALRHMVYTRVSAAFRPDDTDAAEGFANRAGPSPLLGIQPNAEYAQPSGSEPATWIDPELPWSLADERSEALSLLFADGSAWERCHQMEEEELTSLRHLAWPDVPGEQDYAVRGLCEQLVEPYLRVGSGEANYNQEQEPLCHFAGGSTFVYSGHSSPAEVSREEALEAFCAGGLLDDGGFEQRSGWTVDYNADVVSGVNTFVPYAGSQMLLMYLNWAADASFGRAYQHLDQDLKGGDWQLRFMWRVWTKRSGCSTNDPWAVARVDRVDIGEVEVAVHTIENTDWCERLVSHPGGYFKTDWEEVVLPFEGPLEDPVISFIMGTGASLDDHHLLIDDVQLRSQ